MDKIASTFNDNNKMLFRNLLAIIDYTGSGFSTKKFQYGTYRFEYIWESLVDKVYGISGKEEFFPKTYWNIDKLNDAISNIATLGLDYSKMTEAQQYELGAYVNLMNASTQLLINPIKDLSPKFSMTDLDGFMAWKDRKTDKSIYEDNKDFIVSLANLLYKIELDDREKKLLWKSLRKNKKMLKSMDISKKEFDMDLMNGILDALRYKYIQNEKLV